MNYLQFPEHPILVEPTRFLYKWNKTYGGLQRKYFKEDVIYRREKQIEDFVKLNEFRKVKFYTETDILSEIQRERGVKSGQDLTVIANQGFSRYPCPEIINQLRVELNECPRIYLCLTRWYINIDNSYKDDTLSDDFVCAISQWLRQHLPDVNVLDLGLISQENGNFFTWVVPDRHFYLELKNAKNN